MFPIILGTISREAIEKNPPVYQIQYVSRKAVLVPSNVPGLLFFVME